MRFTTFGEKILRWMGSSLMPYEVEMAKTVTRFLRVAVAFGHLSYWLQIANLIISGHSFCFCFNFQSDLIKVCEDLKQLLKQ